MEKKTEIAENFKKVITSTVKSITGDQQIEVVFGNDDNKKSKKTINLPNIESENNKIDYVKKLESLFSKKFKTSLNPRVTLRNFYMQ